MPALPLEHRAWDTQHFGFPVASICSPDLASDDVERSLEHAQEQGYQLVYWSSRRELEPNTPWLSEFQGLLADRKTTFAKTLQPHPVVTGSDEFNIREWQPGEHSAELIELGIAAGLWSRFALDPRIAREKFESLYETWMRRSMARELCDMVLVVQQRDSNIPQGMVTISLKEGIGQIGLISVSEKQRGRGLGRRLMEAADRWMWAHGAKSAQVVTQLQNVAASRMYENAGYKIEKIEYLYHFWLPARVKALSA